MNKITSCLLVLSFLITSLINLTGCQKADSIKETISMPSSDVNVMNQEKDVIYYKDLEQVKDSEAVKSLEEDPDYYSAFDFYKLGKRNDVNISDLEREYIWDLLCYSDCCGFPEFKSVKEIPIYNALLFSSKMEEIYYYEPEHKEDRDYYVISGDNIYKKYKDSIERKSIEVGGNTMFYMDVYPIDAVRELLQRFLNNNDLKSYKDYDEKLNISEEALKNSIDNGSWISIDEKDKKVSYIIGISYPMRRINDLEFSKDGDTYTIIANRTVDFEEITKNDNYEDYIFEKREYKLGKHEDGSYYLKSMKVLEKYKDIDKYR